MIRMLILLVVIVTIFLGLAVMSAGPGYRFGAWDLGTAFKILQKVGPFLAVGGVASLIALLLGLFTKQYGIWLPCLVAIVMAGGLTYSLVGQKNAAGAHPIHDLTTDFTDPPAIVEAANLKRVNPADYVGPNPYRDTGKTVSDLQRELYPDLAPLIVSQSPDIVFDTALSTAKAMKWEILKSDNESGIIEAAYTSPWFGFVDDFIVRVRPEGSGSRVDMRSKSRVGGSDLGANAKRIRDFQRKLSASL